MKNFLRNLKQLLISIDQVLMCFIGLLVSVFKHDYKCYADMTISANAWRLNQKGYWYGKVLRWFIDFLFRPFGKNHCQQAWESEVNKAHLPTDFKGKN